MTIDEAISHAREVAENRDDMCEECRQEHKQLAEWLEELKAKRKMLDEKILLDGIKNYYFEKGYNKAIDELVELIENTYGYDYASDIKPLARQLKEGGRE